MECIEAALKTSIRKEMALKSIPQEFLEEFLWAGNVQNGAPCDDFSVDELLDLSNQEGFIIEEEEEEEEEEVEKTCTVSVALKREAWLDDKNSDGCSNFSVKDDFVSAGELGVPAEDMASLEWLSHFVEDSNSEYSAPFPAGKIPEEKPKAETISEPEKLVLKEACFKTLVPAKARSKRTRTGVRVWPFGSPSVTESPSGSATSSSSSSSSPSSPRLLCTNPGMAPDPADPVYFEKPPAKKQKKKPALQAGTSGGGGTAPQPRRCSHCGVQKTPQWRAGPLGAKTLCNACGVRFKSGRLLPEYRPAGSPTFSSKLHSNQHRKVLEMRREKEMLGQAEPGSASPAVTGF